MSVVVSAACQCHVWPAAEAGCMTNTAIAASELLRDHEPAIRVQSIEKSYKELHVLRGVDFEVAPGSIFALLGSNGAGKTTIVRILSTLLRSDPATPP